MIMKTKIRLFRTVCLQTQSATTTVKNRGESRRQHTERDAASTECRLPYQSTNHGRLSRKK